MSNTRKNYKTNFGFTLIELLIVVAIIAILAAIAIPNFLEAQIRAKVSRAKADMKTIATAIESYAVDYNVYPPNDYQSSPIHEGYLVTPITLTTPISYLSDNRILDPFATNVAEAQGVFPPYPYLPGEQLYYTYQNLDNILQDTTFLQLYPAVPWDNYQGYFGSWRQASIGPDQDFFNGDPTGRSDYLFYDPTNGTVSFGNIWLSENINYDDPQYNPNVTY
jgi:prepilin-type N-terminal cleavage/methylation domain-containing protein